MRPEPPDMDITAAEWALVAAILQKHVPQCEVWAFGSRVKKTAKKHSDLDLVLLGGQALPLALLAALEDDFCESELPWKVDVLDWASTPAYFQQIILKEKIIIQKPALPAQAA